MVAGGLFTPVQVAKEVSGAVRTHREILSRPEGWEWPLVLIFTGLRQCSEIFTAFFFGATENRRYKEFGAVDYLKSMVHTTAVNNHEDVRHYRPQSYLQEQPARPVSQSIGYGYESVKFGMQDAMLCGGADEYDTTTVAVFDNCWRAPLHSIPSRTELPVRLTNCATGLWWEKARGAVIAGRI